MDKQIIHSRTNDKRLEREPSLDVQFHIARILIFRLQIEILNKSAINEMVYYFQICMLNQ